MDIGTRISMFNLGMGFIIDNNMNNKEICFIEDFVASLTPEQNSFWIDVIKAELESLKQNSFWIDVIKAELESLKEEKNALEWKVDDLRDSLSDLKSDLHDEEQTRYRLQDVIDDLRSEVSNLRDQVPL